MTELENGITKLGCVNHDCEKCKAKAEQEPVAYIHRNEYNEYRLEPHDNFDIKSIPLNVDVLLFKTPQRTWVGMTDDEAFELIEQDYRMEEYADAALNLIRIAEAKLKERNT